MRLSLVSCAFAIATFASTSAAQDDAQAPVISHDIVLDLAAADGTPLHGKLTLPPRAEGRVPVVFFLHGAGARTYDSPFVHRGPDGKAALGRYLDFHARELGKLGLALFRISKRGCDVSAELPGMTVDREVFGKATLNVLLDDYAAALAVLRERAEIDPTRIVLMGSSEGTRLAPMLARRSGDGIVGLALMAYAADNAKRTIEWQNTIGPWRNVQHLVPAARDGELTKEEYDAFAKDNAAAARALPFAALDADKDGKLDPADMERAIAPRLRAILAAVEKRDDEFLWKNLSRLSAGYLLDWWDGEATKDILLALDKPVAIFHGTLDGSCRVEGVRETEAAFRAAKRTDLTVFLYEGADHDLEWTAETSKDGGPPAYRDAFAWTARIALRK